MQPPQIVILITTISMSILVTIAWLVGSIRQKDEIPFEDTVRSGWYGRSTQRRARPRRNKVGRSLAWIIQGAFLMLVGLALIMPMMINADMDEVDATVTKISHERRTNPRGRSRMVYTVYYSYFAAGKTCRDDMEFSDPPPFAEGHIFRRKYLYSMPCMWGTSESVELIRLFVMLGATLSAVFGATFISTGVFGLGVVHSSSRS